MRLIPLTQGQFAQVDDWWFDELSQYKWFAIREEKNDNYYAARWDSTFNGKRTCLRMHRVIMNTPDNQEVDHADHNGLNNQEYNLENCTHKKNMANIIKPDNSYGICSRNRKGIFSCYEIYIIKDTIHYYGGSAKTLEKAIEKRNLFIKQLQDESNR